MNFEIKIYQSFDKSLEIIWKDFEYESASYCFQSYYWLKHWYHNASNKNKIEICILIIYQNSKLTMILPFYIEKKKRPKIFKMVR